MCYYRLYIFLGCGHSTFSPKPIRPCAAARAKRSATEQETTTAQGASPEDQPKDTEDPREPSPTHTEDTTTFHTPPASPSDPTSHPPDPESTSPPPPASPQECPDFSTHPFQTLTIHSSCASCLRRRSHLLQQLESESEHSAVRFEDWRWKVKYLSPTPEEARYTANWGSVGSTMGGWVKDWKVKGDEILGALMDHGEDGGGRRDSVAGAGGRGMGIAEVLSPGRKKGKGKGMARGSGSGSGSGSLDESRL